MPAMTKMRVLLHEYKAVYCTHLRRVVLMGAVSLVPCPDSIPGSSMWTQTCSR